MEQPLRSCCLSGFIATGAPSGAVVSLGGVNTYIAKPKDGVNFEGKAVIVATDAFGLNLPNAKLLADAYAEQGPFLVVVPDIFGGKAVDASMMEKLLVVSGHGKQPTSYLGKMWSTVSGIATMAPGFIKFMLYNKEATKMPIFHSVIDELKATYGISKVGIVGYCYGGYFCQELSKEGKVDAFVTNHTMVKVAGLAALKKPGLFICADKDFAFPDEERKKAEEELGKRTDVKFKVKFYPGTYHGFAVRGDETNPTIESAKEDAAKEAITWFQEMML